MKKKTAAAHVCPRRFHRCRISSASAPRLEIRRSRAVVAHGVHDAFLASCSKCRLEGRILRALPAVATHHEEAAGSPGFL